MTLVIAKTRDELAGVRPGFQHRTLALVPTMGALHDGHRSLIRKAREAADAVIVSIFVNPLQFGPNEDFARYPRTLTDDLGVCAEESVDVVFAPTRDVMYPAEPEVTVSAGRMGSIVEGIFRPGHFDGVLTVVMKLLNLVRPDIAVFGEKDAQQLALIRRMVADLDLPVRIVGRPTVRESDGLAMSSRNRYLSPSERATALTLYSSLRTGATAVHRGAAGVLGAARAVLDEAVKADPPLHLDYLVLVDPTFVEVGDDHAGEALLAVAGKVGSTHLIDNLHVRLP